MTSPIDMLLLEAAKRRFEGKCPIRGCAINLLDFRDELSKREFVISGMCQKCQDEIFNDTLEE